MENGDNQNRPIINLVKKMFNKIIRNSNLSDLAKLLVLVRQFYRGLRMGFGIASN